MRAAWIASVGNIDWPSRSDLTTEQQQAEIIAILDAAAELKLNCLIIQIRPAADALYASAQEPWSRYLTGEQGRAPDPFYDPLQMWIEEGHRRGIEIHAWLNPYRAATSTRPQSDQHISMTHPEIVRSYGDLQWMDPAAPESSSHFLSVLTDILERYDIDGIHLDDYFYPYPVYRNGKRVSFPDEKHWNQYVRSGGPLSRGDWRRGHVNRLIKSVQEVKTAVRPQVKFGISPFGIGRPDTAPGIEGFDQYEMLFADPALWLRNGWCDYFVPQLYWPSSRPRQNFSVLHDYWLRENSKSVHVWPGLFTHGVSPPGNSFPATEIESQIFAVRRRSAADQSTSSGHVHFGFRSLQNNSRNISRQLSAKHYAQAALIPAFPWLDSTPPPQPVVTLQDESVGRVRLKPGIGESVRMFAIWEWDGTTWTFRSIPGVSPSFQPQQHTTRIVVTSVDRCGNESRRVYISVPQKPDRS